MLDLKGGVDMAGTSRKSEAFAIFRRFVVQTSATVGPPRKPSAGRLLTDRGNSSLRTRTSHLSQFAQKLFLREGLTNDRISVILTTPVMEIPPNVRPKPVDVVIDAISLSINGVAFFEPPSPEALNKALGSSFRRSDHSGYLWDECGVEYYDGGPLRFWFDLERGEEMGNFKYVGREQAPAAASSGRFRVYEHTVTPNLPIEETLHCFSARDLSLKVATVNDRFPDVRATRISSSDPSQIASNIHVKFDYGRFHPRQVYAMTLDVHYWTYWRIYRQQFGLNSDESFIAKFGGTTGLYQLVLCLTDKRLLALKKSKKPGSDTTYLQVDHWDLPSIRGIRIFPRAEHWWNAIWDRDRIQIDFHGHSVTLEGPTEWGVIPRARKFRGSGARDLQEFMFFLREAVKRGGSRVDIMCTYPGSEALGAGQANAEKTAVPDSMIACQICGRNIAPDATVCPGCGAAVAKQTRELSWNNKSCSLCHRPMSRFAEFCSQHDCGHPNTFWKKFGLAKIAVGTASVVFLIFSLGYDRDFLPLAAVGFTATIAMSIAGRVIGDWYSSRQV